MIPSGSALFLFVTAAIVLLVIPGPAVFYVVGRTLGHGRTAGFLSALGIGVGSLAHAAAAALGISALLASSAAAFHVVKYLGAAYLIFLGVQKLVRRESLLIAGKGLETTPRRIFAQGIIVNVLNPKTSLFFLAFLPQFVSPGRGSVTSQILFLGLLFAVMGLCSDSMWTLLAGGISNWLKRRPQLFDTQRYVSGGMLITLGLATAFSETGRSK
jgi:threonine/homoserine/homoserine lactone efflux protein